MRTKSLFACAFAAMMFVATGCEPEAQPAPGPDTEKPAPGPEDEKPNPDDNTGDENVFVPVFENGICVLEDGSVIVQSDNGIDRINGLLTAIETCADTTVVTTETKTEVACNNTFILQRNGRSYVQGKWVIKNNVVVKADQGEGAMPLIQIMADETGESNADMIRFEANATFKGIYFYGREAMTDAHQQRMLRLDGQGNRLILEDCFADYCRNFFIRTDNTDCRIYLKNSTFRNMAKANGSNGRLVDTRGNGADTVLIHNCLVYNILGHFTRFDGGKINHLEWTNNTFYNCGSNPEVGAVNTVKIENNILGNVGWRMASKAIEVNEETGEIERDDAIWNVEMPAEGTDISNVKIVIRNNNVFNTNEMLAIYAKYPETAIVPTELSPGGKYLMEQGKLTYENNISEQLTFDNPGPVHYDFINMHMSDPDQPEENFDEMPWFIDEDELPGIIPGSVYTYGYPSSAQSATASTTGGKLGASF